MAVAVCLQPDGRLVGRTATARRYQNSEYMMDKLIKKVLEEAPGRTPPVDPVGGSVSWRPSPSNAVGERVPKKAAAFFARTQP